MRLERIAAKHREDVSSARRSRNQNEKRYRSAEVERLSKELRWHELSADEIFGGADDLDENGPKGPMFAGMPAYEYHAQKDASRKSVCEQRSYRVSSSIRPVYSNVSHSPCDTLCKFIEVFTHKVTGQT